MTEKILIVLCWILTPCIRIGDYQCSEGHTVKSVQGILLGNFKLNYFIYFVNSAILDEVL
jgi:hypothetical protein